jgi:hypothetical protein
MVTVRTAKALIDLYKINFQELLQLYCRVCGKRTVASSKNPEAREAGTNGVALKQSPMFRSLLSHLHDLDVDHESAEIFPKRVRNISTLHRFFNLSRNFVSARGIHKLHHATPQLNASLHHGQL